MTATGSAISLRPDVMDGLGARGWRPEGRMRSKGMLPGLKMGEWPIKMI